MFNDFSEDPVRFPASGDHIRASVSYYKITFSMIGV